MENPSYDLAVWHVTQELNRQVGDALRDGELLEGSPGVSMVTVAGMNDCDCIPVSVTDFGGRVWRLHRARRNTLTLDLLATYCYEGKLS
jgi:hypothetical protein